MTGAVELDPSVETMVVSVDGAAINVSGRLNASTIGLLLAAIEHLRSRGAPAITIDLANVEALDSGAVLELHAARADATRAGWALTLRNISRPRSTRPLLQRVPIAHTGEVTVA